MAPKEYRIGDILELGRCSACGNGIVIEADNDLFHTQRCGNPVKLRDGNWLCGSCLRKLRIKYPQEYRMDSAMRKMTPWEHTSELTAEEACRELESIHDHLEGLREQYGFHQAVFLVRKVDVKKGGFLKPPFIIAEGHVIYGTFYSLDDVQIGAGGKTAKISCLYAPHSVLPVSDTTISRMTGKLVIDFTLAEGGEETAFIFQDKNLSLKPGDMILKD